MSLGLRGGRGQPLRIALLGLGYWGRNYIRAIGQNSQAELGVICDGSRSVLEDLHAQVPSARPTADAAAAVAADDVDAVVIATPAPTHYEFVSIALLSGKHVLCEKPLTMSASDADDLVALAEEVGRTLFVGHTFIYNPAIRVLHEIVDQNELGTRMHCEARWAAPGPVRQDVNAVWDLSPHPISILNYLFARPPVTVSAAGQSILERDREDIAFLHLDYGRVATADIHVSWLAREKVRMLTLTGTERVAIFNDMERADKLRVFETRTAAARQDSSVGRLEFVPQTPIHVPAVATVEPLAAQLDHFLECCRDGGTPESGGSSGRSVVQILEAAQASLSDGGSPVQIYDEVTA